MRAQLASERVCAAGIFRDRCIGGGQSSVRLHGKDEVWPGLLCGPLAHLFACSIESFNRLKPYCVLVRRTRKNLVPERVHKDLRWCGAVLLGITILPPRIYLSRYHSATLESPEDA